MDNWWFTNASRIGWILLVVGFLSAAVWETLTPRHTLALRTSRRWLLHGFLFVLGGLALQLVFGVTAIALAITIDDTQYGVFNQWPAPAPVAAILTVLVLDAVQYASHYLRHAIPLLWRFHRVHHADADLDFSTGLRFHPIEALFTHGAYLAAIVALAPPAGVVMAFEGLNLLQSLFSHANIALPDRAERLMRLVQVTPRLHEVHHAPVGSHQQSNYGVIFSFWDRLCRTYREGADAHEGPRVGLSTVSPQQSAGAWTMLKLPFDLP